MWHDTWILRKYFVTKSKGRSFCKIALVLIYIFRVFLWYFKGAQLHIFLKNQENRPLIFRLCALPQKFFQLHKKSFIFSRWFCCVVCLFFCGIFPLLELALNKLGLWAHKRRSFCHDIERVLDNAPEQSDLLEI